MMTKGVNVKTWNETPTDKIVRPDNTNNLSIQDKEKALKGNENVGELLNKIADPNWVDPKKMRKVGGDNLDKDAFLKLMMTQLKNQDPMNPMDSQQMASQLAQFSSLEQLYNINDSLTQMKKDQDPASNFQALNFIGKSIASDSSRFIRSKGDKLHEVRFNLMNNASKVAVKIKDSTGAVVKTIELADLKKGDNKISWNGMDDKSNVTRAGNYSFDIEATNGSQRVAAKTSFKGRVTGVNFTSEGPVLMVGDQSIRLLDVKKIEDTNEKENLNTVEQAKAALQEAAAGKDKEGASTTTPQSLNKQSNVVEGEEAPEAAPEQAPPLADLAMSDKLRSQLMGGKR